MERFGWIAAHLATIAACCVLLRRHSPLHLVVLLLASTALIGAFFPTLSHWIEPVTWRNVAHAAEEQINGVQREYLCFALGILAALVCARAAGGTRRVGAVSIAESGDSAHAFDRRCAWLLVCIGGLLYAVFVARVGVSALFNRDDYAEKYLLAGGLGPFAFGLLIAIAGTLWAEGSSASSRAKLPFRLIAIAIAIWSIGFISVRTNAVVLALGFGWIHARRANLELARIRIGVVLLLIAGYGVLESFSLVRGAVQRAGARQALSFIESSGTQSFGAIVGGSELSHPFLTTLEVMHYQREGDLGGASYLAAVPAFLPRAVLPDRPETLSEQFVRTQYAEMSEKGGGAAFSIVAEAWWNFGAAWGSLCLGFVLASFLCWIEARAASAPAGFVARLAPYFVYLVVITHRSESAILFKQAISIALPCALAVGVASLTLRSRFDARPPVHRAPPLRARGATEI